jgi:hypothetical protein
MCGLLRARGGPTEGPAPLRRPHPRPPRARAARGQAVQPRASSLVPPGAVVTEVASTSAACELGFASWAAADLQPVRSLGVGSFGSVHLARDAEGRERAVKQLPKSRAKLSRGKVLEKLQRCVQQV